jgi:hypothetical protein
MLTEAERAWIKERLNAPLQPPSKLDHTAGDYEWEKQSYAVCNRFDLSPHPAPRQRWAWPTWKPSAADIERQKRIDAANAAYYAGATKITRDGAPERRPNIVSKHHRSVVMGASDTKELRAMERVRHPQTQYSLDFVARGYAMFHDPEPILTETPEHTGYYAVCKLKIVSGPHESIDAAYIALFDAL